MCLCVLLSLHEQLFVFLPKFEDIYFTTLKSCLRVRVRIGVGDLFMMFKVGLENTLWQKRPYEDKNSRALCASGIVCLYVI